MRLSEYLFLKKILVSAELMLRNQNEIGSVVQLVRMSLWYSEGRRFEFFLTHHEFLLSRASRTIKKNSVSRRLLATDGQKTKRWGWNQKRTTRLWFQIFHGLSSESAFMQYIVNRFLCLELNFRRNVIVWFEEHRNLKNLSKRVITKVIIQFR